MTKSEVHDAVNALRKVKAEVIMRGLPYARVRDMDAAIAVAEQLYNGQVDE